MIPYAAPGSQPTPARYAAGRDIARHARLLYGIRSGYLEVGYINGDPLHTGLKRARWFYYTPERVPQLVQYLQQLAHRYGNVYISRTLYRQNQRNSAHALPSRVVFIDDAPEHPTLPYSAVVRTSTGSRHGYYQLDQEQNATTIADLQRRAAATLDADKSGTDIEQMVRIPELAIQYLEFQNR